MTTTYASPKSRLAAALLCLLLGVFGGHRFYLGKHGTAILMLFTLGGLGIWSTVDLIFILIGSCRDANGLEVRNWGETPVRPPTDRVAQVRQRVDGIEAQLTDLQGTVIDLAEKLDRRFACRR